jgi:glycosyltransferase involved in cell wall biosynthesis
MLSIIIPCYNESANLPTLAQKCVDLLKSNSDVEIILVDNGSKDDSKSILSNLININSDVNLKTVHVETNIGYGFGILSGLNAAAGEVLCWTHADLQTDIFDCVKAYNIWKLEKKDFTLVKGKRKGRGMFDVFFTFSMQVYVFFKLQVMLNDINGQPKLFSKKFFELIKQDAPNDFSLDLYFLFKASKMGKIVEFPVYFSQRLAGEAKGGSGNLNLKLKLTKRTLSFINDISKKSL